MSDGLVSADDPGALPSYAQGEHRQTPEGLHCMRDGFSWPCRGAIYADMLAARTEAAALRSMCLALIYVEGQAVKETAYRELAELDQKSGRKAAIAPPEPRRE